MTALLELRELGVAYGQTPVIHKIDLIVAQKDLGSFQQIYRDASGYHERLYSSMNAVTRSMTA